MTAALPPSVVSEYRDLKLSDLAPSATNPRQTFDPQRLAELARTIAAHGVVEPILVRPLLDKRVDSVPAFEIVAGERRWRAAKLAKKEVVPCRVMPLTDKQALEIQTIENAQREDLHPLEQAAGYERLIKDFGYTPEKIADAIGKSRAHVFQIRKLGALGPKLRAAFTAGEMDTTLATVIARVPGQTLQDAAWKQLKDTFRDGFNFRAAADFIRKNFMLDLMRAPFNINDATLVATAGACSSCPKRTGNQADLFADVKNGNVCTDPACFADKRAAAQAKEVKQHEAKGTEVVLGEAAKRLMPYGHLSHDADLVEPHRQNFADSKSRKWSELAKQAGVAPILLQVPETGSLKPVIRKSAVLKALAAKGVKLGRTPASDRATDAYRQKQIATERRNRLETEARTRTWLELRKRASRVTPKILPIMAAAAWRELWHENHKRILDAWKWPKASSAAIEARILKLRPIQAWQLLVDMSVAREISVRAYGSEAPRYLSDLGRQHGVRLETHRAAVQREEKAKKDAKAAAARAKAKPKAKAKSARKTRGTFAASFMRPMQPDKVLAGLVGDKPLARTEITKKVWGYIKRHGLQDKKNPRFINADAKLAPILGKKRLSMFEMTKAISRHLSTAKGGAK